MNILVLKSSPHVHGSSNLLADSFLLGAKEQGHQVVEINVAKALVHPCMACDVCGMKNPCVQKDDMCEIGEQLMHCDMVVFVTPLYYFGFSAQLKLVIDRFYSWNERIIEKRFQSVLIAAAWEKEEETMETLKHHYKQLCQYLCFQDRGMVLGRGCGTVEMTRQSVFPQQAYRLGKTL